MGVVRHALVRRFFRSESVQEACLANGLSKCCKDVLVSRDGRIQSTTQTKRLDQVRILAACSVGWFVLLLVYEEVLLADLCERKILF